MTICSSVILHFVPELHKANFLWFCEPVTVPNWWEWELWLVSFTIHNLFTKSELSIQFYSRVITHKGTHWLAISSWTCDPNLLLNCSLYLMLMALHLLMCFILVPSLNFIWSFISRLNNRFCDFDLWPDLSSYSWHGQPSWQFQGFRLLLELDACKRQI